MVGAGLVEAPIAAFVEAMQGLTVPFGSSTKGRAPVR